MTYPVVRFYFPKIGESIYKQMSGEEPEVSHIDIKAQGCPYEDWDNLLRVREHICREVAANGWFVNHGVAHNLNTALYAEFV